MIHSLTKRLQRSFSTLLIAEQKNGKLNPMTLSALTACLELNKPIDILITGSGASSLKDSKHLNSSLTNSLTILDHDLPTADSYCNFLSKFISSKTHTHIVTAHTNASMDYFPRLAGMLDKQPVSDVISIINENEFRRPIYAGSAIAKVKSSSAIKMLSIRPTNFEPYKNTTEETVSNVEELNKSYLEDSKGRCAEVLKEEIIKSERPELGEAKIIVSGGRGLKNGENFEMLYKLADVLGNTAVGASRAAVDAGYCANDMQVGQTGKVVAPDLYVAVGISGAIQHLAGMKDSKVIVAINKDPEAPIFAVANYG